MNTDIENGSSPRKKSEIHDREVEKVFEEHGEEEFLRNLKKMLPKGRLKIKEDIREDCARCTTGNKLIGEYTKTKFSPTCGKKEMKLKESMWVVATSSIIFFLCLVGTILLFFTDAFNATIIAQMVLTNNSQAFQLWSEPPVHPIMKVHVFNYTNAFEVVAGREKKLRVKDIGPFVYEQTIKRVNIEFNPNGTISYQTKKSFRFIPERNVHAQYDKIIVPNLPMLGAISMAKESSILAQVTLSTYFRSFNTQAFKELPVHRFLWGYEDELVNMAKTWYFLSPNPALSKLDKFGVLSPLNDTSPDIITIFTGEKDMNKFAIIDRYNGYNKLNHWGTDECNRVEGTDGSMFPPSMIDGVQKLFVYDERACRRLPFVYSGEVEVWNGVKAKRYAVPTDVFASPDINPENQCYCHMDTATCPPNGVFNSTPCAFGASVFTSFPHFYMGDPSLTNAIDGLEPTPDKHAMFMDIHPTLGFPMFVVSRMQVNMQLRKYKETSGNGFDGLPNNIFLPILWLEFTVEELPPIIKSLIYHGTFSANAVRLILQWGCVLGLMVTGVILIILMRNKLINRRNHSKQIYLEVEFDRKKQSDVKAELDPEQETLNSK